MSNSYARIGFHSGSAGNQVGIGDYFRSLDDAGIPFIIKSVDDAGILWEAQEIARVSGVPHILIWRKSGVSGDQSKNYDTPDYSLDPALAAEKHWRAHMAAWPPELDPQFVWIETINEPDKHRAEWMADFSWHTAILAGSSGHKYIAFGWSNGEPYIGEVAPSAWVQPCMRAFLQLCAERPDRVAVGLHEYSFDVNDIQAGLPYHLGRFRSLFNTCDEFGITRPTTFITEWGWEKGRVPEPERAMDDIAWANALYSGYATIKGAALWYLGGGFDGIADQAQKLIKPVTEYSLSQGAPVEPPNAGDATGAARVDYARRYWVVPDRTPLLRRQEIYTLAAEKQITVGPSFDDAGLGNLTDKTAVLHSISHSSEQIMVDWYKKWYPGTKVEFESGAEEPAPFFLEWPVGEPMTKKRLTQMYGDRPDYYAQFGLPGHEGLDFAASQGSMIKACHDGIVYRVHTVDDHLYGIHVRIAHIFPDGVKHKTYYAHLESACVRAGDVVKRGQEIGKSGNTGNSTGPHLHVTLVLPGATAAGCLQYGQRTGMRSKTGHLTGSWLVFMRGPMVVTREPQTTKRWR
jgi:murein DD-endopeptidase MepM/ murein hydrolase activator NlpD